MIKAMAAVFTWLNGGVFAFAVAAWLVAVLNNFDGARLCELGEPRRPSARKHRTQDRGAMMDPIAVIAQLHADKVRLERRVIALLHAANEHVERRRAMKTRAVAL